MSKSKLTEFIEILFGRLASSQLAKVKWKVFIYSESILLLVKEMAEAEIMFKVPMGLKEEMKAFPEMEEMVVEFIKLKIFEHELKKSKELQRFIMESLSAKSKLTLEDAMELGNKVKEGMLEELKEKGLI